VKAVFDSNILIDSLNGMSEATRELDRYAQGYISLVTWIEVLAGAKSDSDAQVIRRFLRTFKCIDLDIEIAEEAAILRKGKKLKLPDAVVLATALVHDAVLITRDTDFPDTPGIRIPYTL
jgi:predicted nucleic acid-binding protein